MLLRALPTPLLRTLKKTLTRCIKLAYVQEHRSPCPPYLSKIRDLSILRRILQVDAPWWNLALDQIARLFQQEPEDCHQLLALDMRTIDRPVMETIGRSILYRHTIRQDLPFRLKRLHVWNVSGWTPSQTRNDPKLRLIKRLLRTGLSPYRKLDGIKRHRKLCIIIFPDCRLHTLQASQQKEERFLEAQLSSSLLAGVWTELRKLSREEQCLHNAGSLLDNWINLNLSASVQQRN